MKRLLRPLLFLPYFSCNILTISKTSTVLLPDPLCISSTSASSIVSLKHLRVLLLAILIHASCIWRKKFWWWGVFLLCFLIDQARSDKWTRNLACCSWSCVIDLTCRLDKLIKLHRNSYALIQADSHERTEVSELLTAIQQRWLIAAFFLHLFLLSSFCW